MSRVLIIGAGGVGGVVTHKCAQARDVFTDICLVTGYFLGHSPRSMRMLPVSYVHFAGNDCLYIKMLKEKQTDEALHALNGNLDEAEKTVRKKPLQHSKVQHYCDALKLHSRNH